MEVYQKMQHCGYEYQIASYSRVDGKFQGVILITAHAGVPYCPIIQIPTPSAFKTDRAAMSEASSLALHLIGTEAINALVSEDIKTSSWPFLVEASL